MLITLKVVESMEDIEIIKLYTRFHVTKLLNKQVTCIFYIYNHRGMWMDHELCQSIVLCLNLSWNLEPSFEDPKIK